MPCKKCNYTKCENSIIPYKYWFGYDFKTIFNINNYTENKEFQDKLCLEPNCSYQYLANFKAQEELAPSEVGQNNLTLTVTDVPAGKTSVTTFIINIIQLVQQKLGFLPESGSSAEGSSSGSGVNPTILAATVIAGAAAVAGAFFIRKSIPLDNSLAASLKQVSNSIQKIETIFNQVTIPRTPQVYSMPASERDRVVAYGNVKKFLYSVPGKIPTPVFESSNNMFSGNFIVKSGAIAGPSDWVAQQKTIAEQDLSLRQNAMNNLLAGGMSIPGQEQPKSWWDKAAGALSGFGKVIAADYREKTNLMYNVGSSILQGNWNNAGKSILTYASDKLDLLKDTVKNHWKEILVGVAVGVAVIVAAPVAIIALAAYLSVSTAVVTAAVVAGFTIATGFYVAKTYSPILNDVNDTCDWEGNGKECNTSVNEVRSQLISDEIVLGSSLAIGIPASEGILSRYVVDSPWFLKISKALLARRGVTVVKDTQLLSEMNARGSFDIGTNELTYGDQTRIGDFMHEIRHSTQTIGLGEQPVKYMPDVPDSMWDGPKSTWTREMLEWDITSSKFELEAYQQDLDNARVLGYNEEEIADLKDMIDMLNININEDTLVLRSYET